MAGKCPCRMCNNARVDDELTEDNDLSYFSVGKCEKPFRIQLASGDGKPVRLLFEFLFGKRWSTVAVYYPKHCPNCGRELLEYGPAQDFR